MILTELESLPAENADDYFKRTHIVFLTISESITFLVVRADSMLLTLHRVT